MHMYFVYRPSMNATPITAAPSFHTIFLDKPKCPRSSGSTSTESCELNPKNGKALKPQPWQPSHRAHLSTQAGDSRHIEMGVKGCVESRHILLSRVSG